jgi:PAS domain S-box-containing protein
MSHQPPIIGQSGAKPHRAKHAELPVGDDRASLRSAMDELRRAQEVNRRLLETMPCGVVQVDADGTVRTSNAEAQRILRMKFDEISGKHVSHWEPDTVREDESLLPIDEYPEMVCVRTGEGQGPVTLGIRFEDGTTTWLLYSAAPLVDADTKRVTGAVVSFLDLTNLHQTQNELRETEERYRRLVDHSPDAIFVHDGERFIYANNEAVNLYGAKTQQDLIGRKVIDLIPPDQREFVADRIRNLMSSAWKHSPRRQTKVLRLDGQTADVEAVGIRVQFAGKPAVQVVLHDVSDRVRADQAVRASEERFRTMATVVPVGIYLTDPSGKPIYSNDRWYEIAGLDPVADRGRGAARESGSELLGGRH